MTAREGPCTVTMGIFTFTQKNSAVFYHYDGDAYEGSIMHIINFFHHENTPVKQKSRFNWAGEIQNAQRRSLRRMSTKYIFFPFRAFVIGLCFWFVLPGYNIIPVQ